MGISVLCVSQVERLPPPRKTEIAVLPKRKDGKIQQQLQQLDHRQVAVELLKLLRRRNAAATKKNSNESPPPEEENASRLDGMSTAISIVKSVAEAQRTHVPWESIAQMQRVASQAARDAVSHRDDDNNNNNHTTASSSSSSSLSSVEQQPPNAFFDDQQPYDTFTVLIAWLVLLSSGLYILLKDFLLARWRPRRTRGDSLSDGILTRLPDLDDTWSILMQWYQEHPDLVGVDSILNSAARGGEENNNNKAGGTNNNSNNHHHTPGHLRRRRKR
jgi:hypothetical protein